MDIKENSFSNEQTNLKNSFVKSEKNISKMKISANETENILKVMVEVYLSMAIHIYDADHEASLNQNVEIQTDDSNKKLVGICTKFIESRLPIHEKVVNCGYYDDVDGTSSAETIDTFTDLEETVDFIARTMEMISESNEGFQDEVDSLNESLETYANSLISDQCFKAYESLMKPFENFKESDVQIEGLLLTARVRTDSVNINLILMFRLFQWYRPSLQIYTHGSAPI